MTELPLAISLSIAHDCREISNSFLYHVQLNSLVFLMLNPLGNTRKVLNEGKMYVSQRPL